MSGAADPPPLDALRARLGDGDESVRFNAALDLAERGCAEGIDVLVEALRHPWGVVRRFHARPALVRLGAAAVPALERAARGSGSRAVGAAAALAQIEDERLGDALAVLRRALAVRRGDGLEDALEFLWERRDAASALASELLALATAADEPDPHAPWATEPRVTAAIVAARELSGDEPAHAAFVALTTRSSAVLRWAGALALGHAGRSSPAAVAALAERSLDRRERAEVRVAAVYALARLAEPEAESLPVLCALLADGARWIRLTAARVLGELGSRQARHRPADVLYASHFSAHPVARLARRRDAVPPLLGALADPDPNVRRNSVLALSWLEADAVEASSALATLLGRPYFGGLAAEALARIGESSRTMLERASRGPSGRAADARRALELLDAGKRPSTAPPVDEFYLRVPVEWTREKLDAFEALYERTVAAGTAAAVRYGVRYPKHEFLRYLTDVRRLMLHGTDRDDLDILKPLRSSTDAAEHGNVSGVYAEPDPIRPIYFAVVDRRHSFGLVNACFSVADDGTEDTRLDDPALPRYYRLSVGVLGVERGPWRRGTVYALPRETFEFWEEWTSRVAVRPLLKLAVGPDDLPLKDDLWGADLRKPGSIWVDPRAPFPYLEDVWAVPIRTHRAW